MFVVVSYDIVDNRRRTKLAKALSDFGQRVQKSVFECRLDEKRFLKMKNQVDKLLDFEEDSVRYYTLCARCQAAIEVSGWGAVVEDDEVMVV
ncbi:MAG: CRISPR-associated endonuclease Cas2 [Deltaproteobacteria bacterium]|nr:CRISPR-associated endonuclease Cas2 [Deltaproteobacteria bacterium]